MIEMSNDWEVIYAYSRAQAISDGVLVDMDAGDFGKGETGKQLRESLGIRLPIAMTSTLFGEIECNEEDTKVGQSLLGRFWDILSVFRYAALRNKSESQITFPLAVFRADKGKTENVNVKAVIGAGDDGSPALTFMLPEED